MSFLKITATILKEELKGFWACRSSPVFLLIDFLLKGGNPYRICASWRRKNHKEEVHVYGETPLSTFATIAKEADLRGRFVDLGCGRGRLVFYASQVLRCKARGIEQVPGLVRRAKLFSRLLSNCRFHCQEIEDVDLSQEDFVYLAGTCMEKEDFEKALITMRPGSRLISVSVPVERGFTVDKIWVLPFHFGPCEVYLQTRY